MLKSKLHSKIEKAKIKSYSSMLNTMRLTFLLLLFFSSTLFGKQEYLIGRDSTWEGSNFNGFTENINGMINALFLEVAEKENVSFEFLESSSLTLIPWLEENRYQAVLSTLSPNVINLDLYDFSDALLLFGPVLVVKKSSSDHSLEDLKGKIIGIYAFDDSFLIAQKIPSVIIRSYENLPTLLDSLAQDELDAVIMPLLNAEQLLSTRYVGILKIASPPLSDRGIRLITLKDKQTTLLSVLNRGLKEIKKSGDYEKIKKNFLF